MRQLFAFFTFMAIGLGITYAQYDAHAVFATGSWWRIVVRESGVYKVSPSQIPALRGAECSNVALYSTEGGTLPLKNSDPYSELREMAVTVYDADQNGRIDDEDYVLFFAQGPDVWQYDKSRSLMILQRHPYALERSCFLTIGADQGLRIGPAADATGSGERLSLFTTTYVTDHDDINLNKSGQLWVDKEKFSTTLTTRSYSPVFHNADSVREVRLWYAAASLSSASSSMKFAMNGSSVTANFSSTSRYKTGFAQFAPGGRTLTITYNAPESQAEGYLDFLQFNTLSPIRFQGQELIFHNLDLGEEGESRTMSLSATGEFPTVWDVTDPLHPINMGNIGSWTAETGTARTFAAFLPQQARSPYQIKPFQEQDLHGAEIPELAIVSHHDLMGEAQRLADLHRILDGMEAVAIEDQAVYDEFSGGMQDPIALRHLMRNYYKRWLDDTTQQRPRYLLIMGQGTYDNKNILGQNGTWTATYESPESLGDEGSSFCSDDMAAYLDDNEQGSLSESMDIAVGRIPARSAAQARHVVDKIERYMTRSDLTDQSGTKGDWRNVVTLLSDDNDDPNAGDGGFAPSAEDVAQHIKARYPHYNINRIYADAFVQQSSAIGSFYPDVNNALTKQINYGTLLLNYIGHGSERYIGTERYMEMSDIESYENENRPTFFVTSTCSFGHYDNPQQACGAEEFLMARGGGVGVISASRPITHRMAFNTELCLQSLDPANTIGDALRIAKNKIYSSHSITLFGDPALKLSIPQNQVVVTRINGRDTDHSRPDTADVLSQVEVEGIIAGSDGTRIENFDGRLYAIVYDREMPASTLGNDHPGTEFEFVQQKAVLYKGSVQIENGRFSYHFTVPRDVAYQYGFGRISHYAADSHGNHASGAYDNILFGGFDSDAQLDEHHPEVELFLGDTNFVDGGLTDDSPLLVARIKDSAGINYFGSGLGHDIMATLDGNPNSAIILNDFYEPDDNVPGQGAIRYRMPELEKGPHTLVLRAWNIFNHSGSDTITFVVTPEGEPTIGSLTVFPNPSDGHVNLRMPFSSDEEIQSIIIEIYSSRGQQVMRREVEIQPGSYTTGPIQADLVQMPKGIYMARAIALLKDGRSLTAANKIIKY